MKNIINSHNYDNRLMLSLKSPLTRRLRYRSVIRLSVFLAVLTVLLPWHLRSQAQTDILRRDPVIERKIDSLLALMTIEEKVGQLNQRAGGWDSVKQQLAANETALLKKGMIGAFLNILGAEQTRKVQKIAVEQTRLRIPVLFGHDVIHGYRTVFPIPLGEAATWDPDLVESDCRIAAVEASASGVNWTFAPMVDIARDPRWGRIAEGSGEDPYLGSVLAAAKVRGFQKSDLTDPTTVIACAKHYAAYGGAEGGRDYNTVDISERTLRDVYLPPFHAAVQAGAGTLMSSFNEIGGVPSTANRLLLTKILREEWGFRGFVVSDWGAVGELRNHGVARDSTEATVRALTAGVDMDMESGTYILTLADAVRNSKIPMHILDEAVRRVLRLKFAAGLFRNPYRDRSERPEAKVFLTPAHRAAARRAAASSIVLLKNRNGLLPIAKMPSSIAVIGPLAESKEAILGPWNGMGNPDDAVSILEGIRSAIPSQVRLTYARGCDITFSDTNRFAEAVRVAGSSDVVILVAGETADMSGEASSRADIGLPGVQLELVKRVVATGKPVVLVLMNGRSLCIPWEAEHVPAILETWFGGVEGGNGVADVLFGKTNPGGKLPVTFPRTVGQIPLYYDHKNTGRPTDESERFTSRYIDLAHTPLFPFGYGLSYTTFAYENIRVQTPSAKIGQPVGLSVDVSNTGSVKGDEVVQVYIRQQYAAITRPVRELKAFRRITLEPGEKRTLEFSLESNQMGYTGDDMKYTVEPGDFEVFVGGSSEATLVGKFELVR